VSSTVASASSLQKRKADDHIKEKDAKRERIGEASTPSENVIKKLEPSTVYRGTARSLDSQSSFKSVVPPTKPAVPKKPLPVPVKPSPARVAPAPPAVAPRGFAAILARGQAASQSVASQSFGAIKHKASENRKDRITREREEQTTNSKSKGKATIDKHANKTATNQSRKSTPSDLKGTEKRGEKPKREPVELGYKGTAKPMESTYKGTANFAKSKLLGSSKYNSDRSRSNSATASGRRSDDTRRSRYDYYSEEEGYDEYASDQSSDMEAGFLDVEGEERAALRAAIYDDAEELALERGLKSEKEKRKAALARLAAERAKR
jgi:hypothetical protein